MRRHSFKGLCDSCASVSQVGELACRSWVVSIVLRSSDWMVDSAACFGSVSSYVQLSGRGLRLVQQQCLITCCTSLLCSSLCGLISKFSSGLVTLVQKFGGSSCAGVETISLLLRCEVWSSLRSFLCFLAETSVLCRLTVFTLTLVWYQQDYSSSTPSSDTELYFLHPLSDFYSSLHLVKLCSCLLAQQPLTIYTEAPFIIKPVTAVESYP